MDQAEQLRIIKANKQIRPTARVITVTSGKGGVGKSNMSINLAIQFRKMGKRVVILDADFGLANIEIMFGAVPKHNLCDLVYEGKSISDIITQGPMGVGFISGGSGIAGMSNLGKDALTCIIQNLAELDALTDDHSGHRSRNIGQRIRIPGGERRGAAGDDAGAYFHYGFLFFVKGVVPTSEI